MLQPSTSSSSLSWPPATCSPWWTWPSSSLSAASRLLTTPANAPTVEAAIEGANKTYTHPIRVRLIPLPTAAVFFGHPEGRENLHELSLRNDDDAALAPPHVELSKWLDDKEAASVLYVGFGSLCRFSPAQMSELALGLEACGRPFVWVAMDGPDGGAEWVPAGFEERLAGRGLVIRGWAPQARILGHVAVGGFLTHCDWNSCLEAVAAGVPMATCPLFNDQFYNERLVVEVLRIGVPLGVKQYVMQPEERKVVGAAEVEGAVRRLMDGGEEAEGMRKRAKELGEMAKRAVGEGGSSRAELSSLIQELMDLTGS